MVGTKLTPLLSLQQEISHYLGIPYHLNRPPLPDNPPNLLVGKGTWQEIRSVSTDYGQLKKQNIGLDCSGLAVHLLNFYAQQLHLPLSLDPRRTSADNLTSSPLSSPVTSPDLIQTADLIRTKNGHHVIFIINRNSETLHCVDSSRQGRGVRLSELPLSGLNQTNGVFRLTIFPQSTL